MKRYLILLLLIPFITEASCEGAVTRWNSTDFSVEVLDFAPSKFSSQVIIIPPTGGTNIIDRSYAKKICKRGHRAVILSHWSEDDEMSFELSIHTRFYARAFRAIGLVVEKIKTEGPVGILGTSVGGLHASIAVSRYPEITKAFIITGGAHIPSIIANSNQKVMNNAWIERQKKYGFKNKDEYIKALEDVIKLEPLTIKGKKLGLVIATEDETVPTINQEKLRNLWNPEVVITRDNDHFWAIVSTWLFHADEVYSFFE